MNKIPVIFLDLIAYGAITLTKTNEGIKALISDDFSYTEMKKVLGNIDYNEAFTEI